MEEKAYKVHPSALVAATAIGKDTRIWAFCNILAGAEIGEDCNICDHCSIENEVVIGDRVTIKNSVSLWNGMIVEDDVFIGPSAVFTNDIYPRSKVYHVEVDKTVIKKGATIGANAVVVAGHTIGSYAFIGAGAVVTKDIPDFTIWYGNPARCEGYICKCGKRLDVAMGSSEVVCICGLMYQISDKIISLK